MTTGKADMSKNTNTIGTEAAANRNGHNGAVPPEMDMDGRMPGDPLYNPHNKRSTNAKHSERRKAGAVTEQRQKRFGKLRFDVAVLDGMSEPWARQLAESIAHKNDARDPMKDPPQLMFAGDQAVNAGATDAQITTLPKLSPEEIGAAKFRSAAMLEASKAQVRDMARRMGTEREAAVTPPAPVTLDDLLDEPDEDVEYRIGELWPVAGRVLLAAQYKSGKTTLVGNALRVLVDGGRFLDKFDVTPVGKVVLIDNELNRGTVRRWLRAQRIRNTAAVTVITLRGAVSAFDITDPATRSCWAQQMAGANVVILDCLRPLIDALGLNEDKDAGKVLVAFDALLAEIGADEGMVVTHMGHQNERARGDSRLLDWPDALWKIVRGDDDTDDEARRPRYFSAVGRDVALPESELTYDDDTRHLTYVGGSRKDSAARAAVPELLALVRLEPGKLSKNAAEKRLMDEHGVSQKSARDAIASAIKDGSVTTTPGPKNSKLLSPGTDPLGVDMNPDTATDAPSGETGDQG